jgi:hypothetical protein
VLLSRSSDALFLVQDFGTDTQAVAESGLLKYIYWALQTGIAFLLVYQVKKSEIRDVTFSGNVMNLIAIAILPFIIGLINALIYGDFQISAVVALFGRLFFTLCEITLISIILRGQANLLTLAIGIALVMDRIRVVYASVSPSL